MKLLLSRGGLYTGGIGLSMALIAALSLRPQTPADPLRIEAVEVPMRDGVLLKTIVFRRPDLQGRQPVLLVRTPYNQKGNEAQARRYAAAGYIAITQDCRGRFGSQGVFGFYNGEGQDSYDTVDWIKSQPWSNGKVGMWGHSYLASVQWLSAGEGAALDVLAPSAGAPDFYANQYLGGAYLLSMARAGYSVGFFGPPPEIGRSPRWPEWFLHLPLVDLEKVTGYPAPWQTSFLRHNRKDGFWKRTDMTREFPRMGFSGQHIVGYYDFMCRGAVSGFVGMRERSATAASRANQQLVLGPWDHNTGARVVAGVDFGPAAQVDIVQENMAWFDRHLKGQPNLHTFPRVRYFLMGDNQWSTASSWPPENTRDRSWYLHSRSASGRVSERRLDRIRPAAPEPVDHFRADPDNPVPADPVAGKKYIDTWGPVDQRLAAQRPDVLVFDSPVLTRELRFAGPVRSELFVSTDAFDGDWVVRLIDVHPDGLAIPLATGIRRGSFRDSETDPVPMKPGEVYRLEVDLGHAAAALAPGHRLRVQVAGSCFPLYDRNTNTAEGPSGSRALAAVQSVWHLAGRASRLRLPEVEDGK